MGCTTVSLSLLAKTLELKPSKLALRSRLVYSAVGPPLENGVVEIVDGQISAIHDQIDRQVLDLGNVALIPGLVNAHTHLELSDVASPIQPARPFTQWLRGVIEHHRQRGTGPQAGQLALLAGTAESLRYGCTTLGDIAGGTPTPDELTTCVPPRIVSFLEILGLNPERRAPQMERARHHLATVPHECRGLSPHAPYSVHLDLLSDIVALACDEQVPVAMHIAETLAERELLATGTGEFVDFLRGLGVWRSDAIPIGSKPLDSLRELSKAPRSLVIHGNYLDDEEIEFLATQPQMTVVYCPRTHAFFGHTRHPWRRLLSQGVRVAVGTDSRASNPDLSVFEELRFLKQLAPDLDDNTILQLGTIHGAEALGLDHFVGSLAVGRTSDLAIVSLSEARTSGPDRLFATGTQIAGTLCGWHDATSSQSHLRLF